MNLTRNVRAISVAVAAVLSLSSVRAWALNDEQKQELRSAADDWNAVAPGGVSVEAAQALAIESTLPAYSGPDEVVFEMPDAAPAYAKLTHDGTPLFSWTERATFTPGLSNTIRIDGRQCFRDLKTADVGSQAAIDALTDQTAQAALLTAMVRNDSGCQTLVLVTDKTGLINLSTFGEASSLAGILQGMALQHNISLEFKTVHLSIETPKATKTGGPTPLKFSDWKYARQRNFFNAGTVRSVQENDEFSCSATRNEFTVSTQCLVSGFVDDLAAGSEYEKIDAHSASASYFWSDIVGMYLADFGEFCLKDQCYDRPHRIIDYRKGPRWHSQLVSAALAPADKQKANSLFQTGFESYKSGDFISAIALLKRGLDIDPANYRAWFSLAEIARSKFVTDPSDIWAEHVALYDYRRAVELSPPDTPEFIKSQARLDAKAVN